MDLYRQVHNAGGHLMQKGQVDLVIVGAGTIGGWSSVFAREDGAGRVSQGGGGAGVAAGQGAADLGPRAERARPARNAPPHGARFGDGTWQSGQPRG